AGLARGVSVCYSECRTTNNDTSLRRPARTRSRSEDTMRRLLPLALAAIAASWVLLSPGLAQAGTKRGYTPLVGVTSYNNSRLTPLRYTEKDVEELAKLIDRPSSPFHGNVRLLTTTRGRRSKDAAPTAANVQRELEKLVRGRGRDE